MKFGNNILFLHNPTTYWERIYSMFSWDSIQTSFENKKTVGLFTISHKFCWKVRKSSNVEQDKKTLKIISGGETGNQPVFWNFFSITLLPKILSFTLFSNLWGSSYTKFIILDIKFYFQKESKVVGDSKLRKYFITDCSLTRFRNDNIPNVNDGCFLIALKPLELFWWFELFFYGFPIFSQIELAWNCVQYLGLKGLNSNIQNFNKTSRHGHVIFNSMG